MRREWGDKSIITTRLSVLSCEVTVAVGAIALVTCMLLSSAGHYWRVIVYSKWLIDRDDQVYSIVIPLQIEIQTPYCVCSLFFTFTTRLLCLMSWIRLIVMENQLTVPWYLYPRLQAFPFFRPLICSAQGISLIPCASWETCSEKTSSSLNDRLHCHLNLSTNDKVDTNKAVWCFWERHVCLVTNCEWPVCCIRSVSQLTVVKCLLLTDSSCRVTCRRDETTGICQAVQGRHLSWSVTVLSLAD